jgi:hypothetical protein
METLKNKLILIFIFCISFANGQDLQNDLYRQQNVRTIRNSSGETYFYNRNGKVYKFISKTKYSHTENHYYYNEKSNLIKIEYYDVSRDEDSIIYDSSYIVYIYNNIGKKAMEITYYNNSRQNVDTSYYSYDNDGKLISEEVRMNNKRQVYTKYTYVKGSSPDKILIYSNSNNSLWGLLDTIELKEWTEYKYDEEGKLISETVFVTSGNEAKQQEIFYEYDGNGHLIKIQKNLGGLAVNYYVTFKTTINKYLNGLLIESITETKTERGIIDRETVTFKYNNKNLPLKKKSSDYDPKLKYKAKSIEKYHYTYY